MILAIDPGITTGMAIKKDGEYIVDSTKELEHVYKVIVSARNDLELVLIEDFTTGGRINAYGLHTVRVIGAVEALCWYFGIDYVIRTPISRYQGQAKARGLKPKGTNAHEFDALCHIVAWEIETNADKARNDSMVEQGRTNPWRKGRRLR